MDFPTAVKDPYTGLDVTTAGCQVVNGTVALRARAEPAPPVREQTATGSTTGSRTSAGSSGRTRSSGPCWPRSTPRSATRWPSTGSSPPPSATWPSTTRSPRATCSHRHAVPRLVLVHLVTETLPTTSYVTDGGADVLLAAQPYARPDDRRVQPVSACPSPSASTTTTTTSTPGQQRGLRGCPQRLGAGLLATDTAAAPQGERVRDHRHQQRTEPDPGRRALGDLLRPLRARPPRIRWPTSLKGTGDLRARLQPDRERSGPLDRHAAPDRHRTPPTTTTTTRDRPRPPRRSRPTSTPTRSRSPGTRFPAPWQSTRDHRRHDRRRQGSRKRMTARVELRPTCALPDDPPALPLGGAAPDRPHARGGPGRAPGTPRTGQSAQMALASAASASSSVTRVERLDVEAPAGGLLAPRGGDSWETLPHKSRILWLEQDSPW